MTIAEMTSSVGAVSYTSIDWGSFKSIEGHPLEFLLKQGIPVYYKIHRGIHFAFRHRWTPLGRRFPESTPALTANVVEVSTMGCEEQLLLLRLNDDDLCEILATGSRVVTEFSVGGLSLPKVEPDDSGGIDVGLNEVDFHRCYLINRQRWKMAQQAAAPLNQPRQEHYAEPVWVGYEDLYLEISDISALKSLKNGAGVERERYPFGTEERNIPAPVNWLYQAAFALNRDGDIERNEHAIKAWLRTNSPDRIFNKRWIRTAASLIPFDYKFGARFDERGLSKFRMGEALRSPHIGVPLTFALAITEWWMDQEDSDFQSKRIELAGLLEDVGFQETAVYDLTGMISGEVVSDHESGHFDELLGRWQKEKAFELLKRRKLDAVALSGGDDSMVRAGAASDADGTVESDNDVEQGGGGWAPGNLSPRP